MTPSPEIGDGLRTCGVATPTSASVSRGGWNSAPLSFLPAWADTALLTSKHGQERSSL